MAIRIEHRIDRFDFGVAGDPRLGPQAITNFDVFTNPRRMIPYPDSESGAASPDDEKFQNFCIALNSTYRLYALGVISDASQLAEVKFKEFSTGGSGDLGDTTWQTTSNNQSSAGTPSFNLFVYYPSAGYIYGARAGTHIFRYDPTGGGAWADSHQALTYSGIWQGVVHSKDDILYIPYFNSGGFIAKNNAGSWTTTALTLPKHYKPVSICEYGNYLAIACQHVDGISNSRLFLWDRDSTLATLSESIDLGDGLVQIVKEVEGELIAISSFSATSTRFQARVVFRKIEVSSAVKFLELLSDNTVATVVASMSQLINNRLHFMMRITLHGAAREGVWSIGRAAPGREFALIHERKPNNDTALGVSDSLKGFYYVGDYCFIAYLASNAYALSKTNDSEVFTSTTSIYETQILDEGDVSLVKSLVGISIDTEALPSGAQVVVKYRKDEETSFTTILTHSTDNALTKSAVNIESSGAALPEYHEITFRIESTGNAVPLALSYQVELVGKRAYAALK